MKRVTIPHLQASPSVPDVSTREHYSHDVCPKCGANSVPAEKVPDQALRGCLKCEHVWFEDLDKPVFTFADYRDAQRR